MECNNKFDIGQAYNLVVEGKHLVGRLERIVRMSAPCVSSEDPKDWSYHFNVYSLDPSVSGTYCLKLENIGAEYVINDGDLNAR